MNITELCAHAPSTATRSREVSCREVMHAYLARVAALNPRAHAYEQAAQDVLSRAPSAAALR